MSVKEQNVSQIECVLTKLGVKYKKSSSYLQMCCPIHNGDNATALAFNLKKNKWLCFTQGCQEEWGCDIVGLIAGVQKISRRDAFFWMLDNVGSIERPPDVPQEEKIDRVYQEDVLLKLFKTDFYLKKGFQQSTLDAFEHGMANAHKLSGRVVFPIRDEKGFIRGFSGRWAGKEIEVEKKGKLKMVCVDAHGNEVPKWRHTSFTKTNYCYRLREAAPHCEKELIVVESIGNAMRFYDAGCKNCIAVLGSFISDKQASLILKHTRKVILAFDNDKAGLKATKQGTELLEQVMDIVSILPPEGKDWGEMTNQEVLDILHGKRK
jgi:DNA primase